MVDRTIPIHARTLGLGVPPHEMGVYCRVVRPYRYEPICMLLVQTGPPLVRTHTSNPAFPTGGGLGGSSFFAVVLNVCSPLRGGGPTISPWETVVTFFSLVYTAL